MDGILKNVIELPKRFRKDETEMNRKREEERILRELDEVLLEMRIAEQQFNESEDNDLTESSIYELTALHAKYRYWYRKACAAGISVRLFRQEQGRMRNGTVENGVDSGGRFVGGDSSALVGEK